MLYRLSLANDNSFNTIIDSKSILINYMPYSNYIDILDDREDLTARNQKDILNITSLVYSINKINTNDLIWIKRDDNYLLAKVKEKLSLDPNNAKIRINLELYAYKSTPRAVKDLFDDIKFALVDNSFINSATVKIYNILENKEKNQVCEMEFIKGNGELVELEKKIREIEIYSPREMEKSTNYNIKNVVDNCNSGEFTLERRENSALAVRNVFSEEYADKMKEIYLNLMKEEMDEYMKAQQEAMNEFMKRQSDLLDKFFNIIK